MCLRCVKKSFSRAKLCGEFCTSLLVFTPKCNLPPNASAKFLSAKILPENPGTSKSEVDELQNDRI